jgi:hypothetical protein
VNVTETEPVGRFAGEWRPPGNADNRAPGTLTIEMRHAELAMAQPLSREWYGELAQVSGAMTRVPAIHGIAAGTEFTLLGCDLPVEFEVSAIVTADADAVVQDAHVAHAGDDQFGGVCLRVQNLGA